MMNRKMLGEDAHKALSDMTKKKLFPMMQTFRDVCLEDIVPDTKDDLVIIDEAEMTDFENKKPHCPICGCETATEVNKSNGILGSGHASWSQHWVCDSCSVMFKKKDKFFR